METTNENLRLISREEFTDQHVIMVNGVEIGLRLGLACAINAFEQIAAFLQPELDTQQWRDFAIASRNPNTGHGYVTIDLTNGMWIVPQTNWMAHDSFNSLEQYKSEHAGVGVVPEIDSGHMEDLKFPFSERVQKIFDIFMSQGLKMDDFRCYSDPRGLVAFSAPPSFGLDTVLPLMAKLATVLEACDSEQPSVEEIRHIVQGDGWDSFKNLEDLYPYLIVTRTDVEVAW